ncbi:PmoA family protein [Sabulilitoribacter arenilitoris]|uniref:PmoA family protein n=1 Tax=Wocania arenilitoris TaxID=2044858 RepID=A0AAE3EPP0_9FLAO|nr:PmoA family protein [Wocania arenilitoris]MCF7569371.1 PmoA family protein [Wocania arenilitoris]
MKLYLLFLILINTLFSCTEDLIHLKVDTGAYDRLDCPVFLDYSILNQKESIENLQLVEIINSDFINTPSQINKQTKKLWFVLNGFTPKETSRKFALVSKSKQDNNTPIKILKKDGGLLLTSNGNPILNYQFEIKNPPEGVDEKYKKSGFIHPVYSPEGEVLTRIQPPDHYHHYGIWGPWTKTHIEGRFVDFWNIGDGLGTVLFKDFLNETQGDVYSSFTALQEHIDFGAEEKNRIALNEELEIKAWNISTKKKSWLIDYTTKIKSPLDLGILFDAYRYGGGIGFRATEKWHKDNASVLTSEGKDRLSADGTSAKWAIIEGESETKEGRSGILFMGYPDNKEFPEPMRVWPINSNGGRGDMFFEFCPIRHIEWKIESKKEYSLNYRMLIFDGEMTAEQAEIHWQGFANPPKATIISKQLNK